MKFFGNIAKAIDKIWRFCTRLIVIALFMAFILFLLAVIMPDNVLKAVEILKSLLKLGG